MTEFISRLMIVVFGIAIISFAFYYINVEGNEVGSPSKVEKQLSSMSNRLDGIESQVKNLQDTNKTVKRLEKRFVEYKELQTDLRKLITLIDEKLSSELENVEVKNKSELSSLKDKLTKLERSFKYLSDQAKANQTKQTKP